MFAVATRTVAAWGAFFAGLGALISALLAMRAARNKTDRECADKLHAAWAEVDKMAEELHAERRHHWEPPWPPPSGASSP
jgi:hypothetical protein